MASTITSMPFCIDAMLPPSKAVEEFVANVNIWEACIELIVKELPVTLEIAPIIC